MEKKPTKRFWLVLVCWVLSAFFLFTFLWNSGFPPKTPVVIYDLSYLIASFVFFLLPITSSLKLGNLIDWKKELEEGNAPTPEPQEPAIIPKTAMEYKILNTLWNKQVGKIPDLHALFTFRLNQPASEFLDFREAGNRLMGEGLISETDTGQFGLTWKGLRYCAEHHKEFPADMWGEYEHSYQNNLSGVLERLRD
jgi:hypothetical protein